MGCLIGECVEARITKEMKNEKIGKELESYEKDGWINVLKDR